VSSVVETGVSIIAPALSLSYNRCSHFLLLRRLPWLLWVDSFLC
jgi:hypothetical protein